MKDEIKEILETFKKINEEYSLDTDLDFEDYEIPNIYLKQFLDYITNLQKYYNDNVNKYEELLVKYSNLQEELKVSQTNEETYRLEMEEITKILGLDEHTIFDEVKEYATNLQEKIENKIIEKRG